MKRFIGGFFLLLQSTFSFAQPSLDYYFPGEDFLPGIPTPASFFGHEVGEWHLSHDKLYQYLREVADNSERVVLQEYARSHENRPLFHLIFTSPGNQERLEEIREKHLELSDPAMSGNTDLSDMPVVLRLGYGVHGNESSASNSAVLMAYYLAASNSEFVRSQLDQMIILLDPCLNPDGFNRHASWVNMHKSSVPMSDPNSRGFDETWPGGRTNHYWFDLNRDWILLAHPESEGRVRIFHEWKPNVQTDHHEMGSSSSFFFQPGIPSRTNPYTPQGTTDLTRRIGEYHAEYLDEIGTLFFTEEIFDDYYYGKGSSYPDVNGAVGILFEQAGTRGYERHTSRGMLSFPYAIRNQVRVSLSSLKASQEMRLELLEHQRAFYSESQSLFEASTEKAYIFGDNGDFSTLARLLDVLEQHRIDIYQLAKEVSLTDLISGQNKRFSPPGKGNPSGGSYVIPLNQPQYRLIQSLFQPVRSFTDSLFYDISAWTFPMAYNVPYSTVTNTRELNGLLGEKVADDYPVGLPLRDRNGDLLGTGSMVDPTGDEPSMLGYIFPWDDYFAPRALYRIQSAGLLTQVATQPIGYRSAHVNKSFAYGSIFIPVEKQAKMGAEEIHTTLKKISAETGINIYPLSTSFTSEGMDMGSGRFAPLKKPKILLLTGEGVRSLDAGEIWHLLDRRMNIPVVLVTAEQLNGLDLSPYTHLLMPSGGYSRITESGKTEIERWLRLGGTIVALNSANQWLADNTFADIRFQKHASDTNGYKPYSDLFLAMGAQRISGSIFLAEFDRSHPIGYGIPGKYIPVFRNSTLMSEPVNRPYAVPLRYTSDPLLSGYAPDEKYDALRNAPGIIVNSRGSGMVISFLDNPNFRGFWYGSNRLFLNSIFFGPVISDYSTR